MRVRLPHGRHDPDLRTHRVLMPGENPFSDATAGRRVLVGAVFILAMVALSAWIGVH